MTNVTPPTDENVYYRRKPNHHLSSNHILCQSNEEIQAADSNHIRARNDVRALFTLVVVGDVVAVVDVVVDVVAVVDVVVDVVVVIAFDVTAVVVGCGTST